MRPAVMGVKSSRQPAPRLESVAAASARDNIKGLAFRQRREDHVGLVIYLLQAIPRESRILRVANHIVDCDLFLPLVRRELQHLASVTVRARDEILGLACPLDVLLLVAVEHRRLVETPAVNEASATVSPLLLSNCS